MSYYYTYYIGVQKKDDNLIYPLGPYNFYGDMTPAFTVSRSFSSDLHEKFSRILKAVASDDLKKEFPYEGWEENDEKYCSLKMLRVAALPAPNFIKSGYVLVDDVKKYENGDYDDLSELFQEVISPTVYANMLSNELLLGKKTEYVPLNEEGDEIAELSQSVGEYMFYSFPDYNSEEYESFIIKNFVTSMSLSDKVAVDDKLVILLAEG